MITIHCARACAHLASSPELLTAGMQKAVTVRFVFSADWDGLQKTAVFTNGRTTVDVLAANWDGDTVTVPHEVLAVAGRTVRVGVYGTNADGVVLPTVWVTLGKVMPAADPSGDPSTDAALPVWAQLQEIIGDLSDLTTKAKANLVAAINEAAKSGGGSGGAGSIDLRATDEYIQYSTDGGATWQNLIALADLKGEDGAPGTPGKDGKDGTNGQDGYSPSASVTETDTGATITITDKTGTTTATVKNGKDGAPGEDYVLTEADKTEIAAEAAAALAGTSVPAPASAAVGQIVKVKAVDAEGKITETEAVDMPSGADVRWQTVRSFTLEEDVTRIAFDTDENGVAISDYKPVAIKICLDIPADSTQTSENGAVWSWPMPLSGTQTPSSRYRAICYADRWKTIQRQLCILFFGDAKGLFASTGGSVVSLIPSANEDYSTYQDLIMGGVLLHINASGDHIPAGTVVSIGVLTEVEA